MSSPIVIHLYIHWCVCVCVFLSSSHNIPCVTMVSCVVHMNEYSCLKYYYVCPSLSSPPPTPPHPAHFILLCVSIYIHTCLIFFFVFIISYHHSFYILFSTDIPYYLDVVTSSSIQFLSKRVYCVLYCNSSSLSHNCRVHYSWFIFVFFRRIT